jgi:hypothetical protein
MTITAERVRELFSYSEETGLLTRLVRTAQCVHVGDVTGSLHQEGPSGGQDRRAALHGPPRCVALEDGRMAVP